ncbi:MAG: hypothetical protein CVU03_07615 [Bacteroidetes bacterium HGW-Bacteroidetes-2]|jgi:hypothetical protein|nr:MAG: hypothetical protein CVU03_07615 [Bacteroidetes bacterium HGW-Bacteroidetes-2]
MKNTTLILIVLLSFFSSKAQKIKNSSLEYIQDYYSDFSTGYDFDGKYISLSDNYKAIFSDAIFTLTFNTYDEQNNISEQTITINLKNIVSIKPNGTDVVEIFGNDPLIVPICGKLAFKTKTEEYDINIYYEVDEDVERTKIYKTFKTLIETHKN